MKNTRPAPDRTEIIRRLKSIFTSQEEAGSTAAAETILRQALIPANTFNLGKHFNIRGVGFAIDTTPANITALKINLRFGNTGTTSPLLTNSITYNPGTAIAFWFLDHTLSRDSSGQCGLGGMFHIEPQGGGVPTFRVDRGEIAAVNVDFTVDNFIYLTGGITAGADPFIFNEVFQVYEVPQS